MIQTPTGPKAATYAEFKALKKRREVVHPVVLDNEAWQTYRAAKNAVDSAPPRTSAAEMKRLQKDLEAAEEALRGATLLMRLRALPRKPRGDEKSYAQLRAEHPPRDEDHAELAAGTGQENAKTQFNAETFGPVLVAACLIEPKVSVEEAAEMAAEMNEAEWAGLFTAAISANQTATPTGGLVFS